MNSVKAVFLSFLLFAAFGAATNAQDSFKKGEELFLQNKPQEALAHLQTATTEDPAHVQAFIYLGIVYQQLNRLDNAIETYIKILPRAGNETARVNYNLGNAYFSKGDFAMARRHYTQAIEADPYHASAYLNRANSLVKIGELEDALTDYETYLSLGPFGPKREQVIRLMAFIREEFTTTEQRRVQAEEAAQAELERRRRLLEEVTDSLHAAAEALKGLSAGTEDVQDYSGEFELE